MVARKRNSKPNRKTLEKDLCCAQQAQQYWTQLEDKNTKYFQITATIKKRHNYI